MFKRIDTCAGEFASADAVFVLDLRGRRLGCRPARPIRPDREKIIILGGGPNRIGQGIEFDYCCVPCGCIALREAGLRDHHGQLQSGDGQSTDYDTSDRLYFEPLTAEDVTRGGARREQEAGTLTWLSSCSIGGQTPLKLSQGAVEKAGIPILGTSADESIDIAEDREQVQGALLRIAWE